MSNWKIGDDAVCVASGLDKYGLVKDKYYKITGVQVCTCGCVLLSYGVLHGIAGAILGCTDCPKSLNPSGEWWCSPEHFRKPAKPKVNYRLANLEILTQFPVIKERSDQPQIKEQEVEHA